MRMLRIAWWHRPGHRADDVPRFPYRQLFILALVRICEPIAFMSIFPYAYYMVESFNLTSDSDRNALYVGLITSAFAFAEFSSGILWGKISDRIGRKPVLLAGLAGTALSMILFGFAQSLPMALIARALGGLLNGNMGVLQTTVAELVTVKKHQPRAFSIMPFVWCLGSVLGPSLGGALARPCLSFPSIFPSGTVFDRYPFLLPNIICTAILSLGVLIGILFLEETHDSLKHQRDRGLETGRWLLQCLQARQRPPPEQERWNDKMSAGCFDDAAEMFDNDDELPEYSFADEGELPGYKTTDGTPRQSSSRSSSPAPHLKVGLWVQQGHRSGNCKTFTRQVVLSIGTFGLLAYHSISFDQLMPVFLSEPVAKDLASLPLHFTGGFGYSTKKIGFILAIQGLYSMVAQLVIFPFAASRMGSLNTLRLAIWSWPLLYVLVPYTVLLPSLMREGAVYAVLLSKITFHVLAFPSVAILIANAAPSKQVLGLVNGAAASTASLARALGPTVTGAVHSWGLDLGVTGIAWWFCGIICLLGAIESLWMREDAAFDPHKGVARSDEDPSAESLLDPAALEAALPAADLEKETRCNLHKTSSIISCRQLLDN